ncbi:muscle M-line assembly protein unc-89 isoform X1 [Fundulus heteroclitus]|uniref:muscle M-line assembly protein unc-89 isoform X1 n=1 Tax=Fundulus heteroclitus TaxID=8078 RepID=UPI00165AE16B|nr:muscle M-line assembly protein unc-89 isoform X1 [Fundulus heteroclitus]
MDAILRRPKGKLGYIREKKSLSNRWGQILTTDDVDKLFDDLDVCASQTQPPSVLFQSSETIHSEEPLSPILQEQSPTGELPGHEISGQCQSQSGDVQLPTTSSPIHKLDIDLCIPFKTCSPIKTSSPREHRMSPEKLSEDQEVQCVTPILFNDVDEAEELHSEPVPTQRPQSNTQVPEDSDDLELESPPSRIVLTEALSHKATFTISSVNENVEESKDEGIEPVVTPTKKAQCVSTQPLAGPSSAVGKEMDGFLKKLQLARMSKPSCSQISKVKVQLPPPPLQPEDFMILEDDSPIRISIPRKAVSKKRQSPNESSSTPKESLTDERTKDGPVDVPQRPEEGEMAISKPDSQAVNQRKKKSKKKNPEVVEPEHHKGDSLDRQDLPAGDAVEQEMPTKKKQRRKVLSEQSDEPEDPPRDETEPEKEPAPKTGGKGRGQSKGKTLKQKKEITAKDGKNSLKEKRKQREAPEAAEEQSQEQNGLGAGDAEAWHDVTDQDVKSKADGGAKEDIKSVPSIRSSSEDAQLPRKRKPPGEWWKSCPQSPERTEKPQPLKKSKQKSKESDPAVPLTSKNMEDKSYGRRKAKDPAKVSNSRAKEAKGNKGNLTKRRNERDEKIKEMPDEIPTAAAELEEQEIPDEDLDQESSPLVFSERRHSLNSSDELFQKVYHHTSKNTATSTAPVAQLRQPRKELRNAEPAKRRRKPPGEWWTVPTEAAGSEIISPSPRRSPTKELGPRRQRKQPKRTEGNAASQTPGGAPVILVKPLSPQSTVKSSLAAFKDLTSVAGTPAAAPSRDRHQCRRRNVTSRPAQETVDGGPVTCSRSDADGNAGGDGGERSQETPQDGRCQADPAGCPEDTRARVLMSGPSSMIELQEYDDETTFTPPGNQTILSMSDFCGPPLSSLTLHSRDKAYLTEWMQNLWSAGPDQGATITPDQFQWYLYKDRALGVQVEISNSSFCSGKLLMGSYMMKPLWVDHGATTIFSLVTGSVRVTIDCRVSSYCSGQSFLVECGRAFSIQNNSQQPAVLFFTRILADSLS